MSGPAENIAPAGLERVASHPFIHGFEFHEQAASTNDLALSRAGDEALDLPLLILAGRQTDGRGRGGNHWWSAAGALTFSLVIDSDAFAPPDDCAALLPLITALAVRAGLEAVYPAGRFKVKWPNDVYLEGLKLAGILLERSTAAPGRVVVGVGVNLNNSMADADDVFRSRATSLLDTSGQQRDLCDTLCAILTQLSAHAGHDHDPRPLGARWRDHCLLEGCNVRVFDGRRRISGACLGIDASGALRVRNDAGTHRLISGTVEQYG